MRTINFRIYLRNGLSFDIVDKTDEQTYAGAWNDMLRQIEGKPQNVKCWRVCQGKNNKLYMVNIDDIVCFERLDK